MQGPGSQTNQPVDTVSHRDSLTREGYRVLHPKLSSPVAAQPVDLYKPSAPSAHRCAPGAKQACEIKKFCKLTFTEFFLV